jgi:DNA invertase Pin-like site-specific DNA recombinase
VSLLENDRFLIPCPEGSSCDGDDGRGADLARTRTAIYMRVSKDDGSQDPDNQLRVLREEVERAGEELVGVYVDRESGRKGRRERSGFAKLFEDAERKRFDLVRFWALDRFSREGIRKTISYLQRLDHLGVRFTSHTEPYLNTDNELIAHIVLGVTSYYAELEAQRISERTKAGLARARASGKAIGRPDGFGRWRETLEAMRAEGYGTKRMSRETRLSYNTVKKYLTRLDAEAEDS